MKVVLTTERLTLRHATTADQHFMFELVNDPAFIRTSAIVACARWPTRNATC